MPERIEHRARFDLIRYANVWEDAELLVAALRPGPGKRFLSIASAGDNSLSPRRATRCRYEEIDLHLFVDGDPHLTDRLGRLRELMSEFLRGRRMLRRVTLALEPITGTALHRHGLCSANRSTRGTGPPARDSARAVHA